MSNRATDNDAKSGESTKANKGSFNKSATSGPGESIHNDNPHMPGNTGTFDSSAQAKGHEYAEQHRQDLLDEQKKNDNK